MFYLEKNYQSRRINLWNIDRWQQSILYQQSQKQQEKLFIIVFKLSFLIYFFLHYVYLHVPNKHVGFFEHCQNIIHPKNNLWLTHLTKYFARSILQRDCIKNWRRECFESSSNLMATEETREQLVLSQQLRINPSLSFLRITQRDWPKYERGIFWQILLRIDCFSCGISFLG